MYASQANDNSFDSDYEEWSDSDKVFSELFRSCVEAGPEKCALAAANLTAEQLEADTWDMVDGLKENPIPIGNGSIVLNYPNMRNLLAYSLYGPSSWPQVAEVLNYMRTNDTSNANFVTIAQTLYQVLVASTVSFPPLYGIHCSDRVPRLDTLDEFFPVQEKLNNISKVMDGTSTLLSMTCAQWKTDARERYEGDFQVETKNPVLVSTNKYDGHTPIRSARNVSSGFEGSGMLVVNGFGVSDISQESHRS